MSEREPHRWRVNITCPKCQYTGNLETSFPCDHEHALDVRLGVAFEERDKARATLECWNKLRNDLASRISAEARAKRAEEALRRIERIVKEDFPHHGCIPACFEGRADVLRCAALAETPAEEGTK